jgi:hypothetical protein
MENVWIMNGERSLLGNRKKSRAAPLMLPFARVTGKEGGQCARDYRYPTSTLSHKIHFLDTQNGVKKSLGR